LDYLPGGAIIDGEIYNHFLSHQSLLAIIRTENFRHPQISELAYYIFDLWTSDNLPFEKRRATLEKALTLYREEKFNYSGPEQGLIPELWEAGSKIYLAQGNLMNDESELLKFYQWALENQYEGVMVKRLANGADISSDQYLKSTYKFCGSAGGGCDHILKLKPVYHEECLCIDVIEGKGGHAGCAILIVVDPRNNKFKVVPKGDWGTLEERKKLFSNQEYVLGKAVTVEYRGLTDDGVPKFAKAIAVRDYEGGGPSDYALFSAYSNYVYYGKQYFQ
jgi:ATP-dependent DNA ligase